MVQWNTIQIRLHRTNNSQFWLVSFLLFVNTESFEELLPCFWQTNVKPETWPSTSTEPSAGESVSHRIDPTARTHSHAARIPLKCQLTFVLHNSGSSWASWRAATQSTLQQQQQKQQKQTATTTTATDIQLDDDMKNKPGWTWWTLICPPALFHHCFNRRRSNACLLLNRNTLVLTSVPESFFNVRRLFIRCKEKDSKFAGTAETVVRSDKYFTTVWIRCEFKYAVRVCHVHALCSHRLTW